jgi:hypothetical protein
VDYSMMWLWLNSEDYIKPLIVLGKSSS